MSDILTLDTGLYSIVHPDIIHITICNKFCVNEVVLICQFVLSSYCRDNDCCCLPPDQAADLPTLSGEDASERHTHQ